MNIIEFLRENDYGVSKTKVSKELRMHINTVDKYLDKLKDLELIKMEKISNQNLFFLNKELYKKLENRIVSEID